MPEATEALTGAEQLLARDAKERNIMPVKCGHMWHFKDATEDDFSSVTCSMMLGHAGAHGGGLMGCSLTWGDDVNVARALQLVRKAC